MTMLFCFYSAFLFYLHLVKILFLGDSLEFTREFFIAFQIIKCKNVEFVREKSSEKKQKVGFTSHLQ